jgi:hypothetical protein
LLAASVGRAATTHRCSIPARSLGSENPRVLRVPHVARDDFGILALTLIYAEIVMRRA